MLKVAAGFSLRKGSVFNLNSKGDGMKKIVMFMLVVLYLSGCANIPKKFLPPIYEKRYPLIAGVQTSRDIAHTRIDSMLVDIIAKSELTSGVLNEPFDKEMVDIVIEVIDFSLSKKEGGEIQGRLSLDILTPDGNPMKTFNAEAISKETEFLLFDLLTIALDKMAFYLEEVTIEPHHKIFKEKKVATSDITLHFPTLTDFRRKTILVKTAIQGNVPPKEVKIVLNEKNQVIEVPFHSQELYFEHLKNIDAQKEWLYSGNVNSKNLSFNTLIEYSILSSDIMGNEDILKKGELHTISKGLFRLKQAEVLAHGTIITTAGGLVVMMLLYSL